MQAGVVMAVSDFIGPFIIALIIHALVFSSESMNHDAQIVPHKGASSVTLTIVPSAASRASKSPLEADVTNDPGRNNMTGTQEESVRPIPETLHTPSVKKTPSSNRSAWANEAALKGDATPPHGERVLPEEHSSQQEELKTEQIERARQIAESEKDVTEKPLMLQEKGPSDAGDARRTGGNDGDVREQGVRVPASAVGLSKPAYPRFSRIYGEEGTVVLSVEVLADGNPGKIEIVSSSGYRRLDRAAVKAVGKARFIAAKIDGKAVDSMQRIAFRFNLDD
jgi:TonB family protein